MGDRCYLQIEFRNTDEARIAASLGKLWYIEIIEEGSGWKRVGVPDADVGFYETRVSLAEEGMAFTGYHEAGDDYEACRFAAFNGEHLECSYLPRVGCLVIAVTGDGDVSADALVQVKAFIRLDNAASSFIERMEEED